MKNPNSLLAVAVLIFQFSHLTAVAGLLQMQSATLTDENGDGVAEALGLGFGHPGDPNYGTTLVQKGGGQFPYERRSVQEFTLSGITIVQSATLTFSFYNSNGTASTFDTFLTAGDGQILLSDFSLASTQLGSRTVPGNQVDFISYDVTSITNSILSAGFGFLNVRQQISGTGGGSEVFLPQLDVTILPEPNSLILFGLGSIAYICVPRRRNPTA